MKFQYITSSRLLRPIITTYVGWWSSLEYLIWAAQSCRQCHFGARHTYQQLANILYLDHCIPICTIMSSVASCPICQKYRLRMVDNLKPVELRYLESANNRSVVGYDTRGEILPRDEYGNLHLDIIINHFTKFVKLYPKSEKAAVSSALGHFQYSCAYVMCDVIMQTLKVIWI